MAAGETQNMGKTVEKRRRKAMGSNAKAQTARPQNDGKPSAAAALRFYFA